MEQADLRPANLEIIAGFLSYKQVVVQTLAAQVLASHVQKASRDSRDAVVGVLVQHLDALQAGAETGQTSTARGLVLQLFAVAHGEQLIELRSEVARAVTACLYDKDVMVQAQALELLRRLDCPLLFLTPDANALGSRCNAAVDCSAADDAASTCQEQERDRRYVMIEGQPTRLSDLMKEPMVEIRNAEATTHWIRALNAMDSFDEDSMRAVTEKLAVGPHWSVRRAAVAYLLCGLKVSPPPLLPLIAEEASGEIACLSRTSSSHSTLSSAKESVLVGKQNEQEITRKALEYLRNDAAGVRNAAAQVLHAILPSNNGARDVILEGSTLQEMLADPRTRQLCFTAFADDSELIEKCQTEDGEGDRSRLPLGASERRCAAKSAATDPLSNALDRLLISSKDADVSVRISALETWGMNDFSGCDEELREAAIAKLMKHACNFRHAVASSREIAVRSLRAIVVRGHQKVTKVLLELLEDDAAAVRMAAADTILELAPATQDVVSHLIQLVDRPQRFWTRRDDAAMEIKAAAFWILSKIEPQFSTIPISARRGGNHRVVDFLWGNASVEKKLLRDHEMHVWVKKALAAGDSLLVKVRRAIREGRWEDARYDANQAMEEFLIAKSKGSQPEILYRILDMDQIFSDIANFRGQTWKKPIDAKLMQIDESWAPDIHAVDRQGWTRLHYLSRWNMPQEIKEMVAAGLNINASVSSGAYRGATPFDLAETDALRTVISSLGGNPSRSAVPEYSIIAPTIPRPKTDIRMRTTYTEDQLAEQPDSRRCGVCRRAIAAVSFIQLVGHDEWML